MKLAAIIFIVAFPATITIPVEKRIYVELPSVEPIVWLRCEKTEGLLYECWVEP